jgi:hypothetical protein
VTKLNPAGSLLDYSTYLGGNGGDVGTSIALNAFGNAYVAGYTKSTNFPISATPYQSTNLGASVGNPTAFVTELNAAGTALVYSTYLGGSGNDSATGIAIDGSGDAYVIGNTFSTNFPVTPGALQTTNKGVAIGQSNVFITKLNPQGAGLLYSTYLGGSGISFGPGYGTEGDCGTGIAVDAFGNAYVTGSAYSTNFPVTSGAFQTKNNSVYQFNNAFISKLNPTGTQLIYSTYLGGNTNDGANAIAIDSSGQAYVTGMAYSEDFPTTPNAYQVYTSTFADHTAFFTVLNTTGSQLVYSTYLGGTAYWDPSYAGTNATAIAVDNLGNAYLAGFTNSFIFPVTSNAFQPTYNAPDDGNGVSASAAAFVTAFAVHGSTSTYLASNANPQALGKSVTYTASVRPVVGTGIPTGTVYFYVDNGADSQSVQLDGNGNAAYTPAPFSVGQHRVYAYYSGDSSYGWSSTSLVETIFNVPHIPIPKLPVPMM